MQVPKKVLVVDDDGAQGMSFVIVGCKREVVLFEGSLRFLPEGLHLNTYRHPPGRARSMI